MLEYFVCVVAVAGVGTLVFVGSLVVMLAHVGIARAFRPRSIAPSQTRRLSPTAGSRDLERGRPHKLGGGQEIWSSSAEPKSSYEMVHDIF